MADARKLSIADLREIVGDPGELAKGGKVFDDGGLDHLSRYEHKLFADARGSGAAPYKVQILFEDKGIRGRCSCMAARTRPFCKHAAALLVGWARAPESFAVAAAPPPGMADGGKKREVKKGKVDDKTLIGRGVEQVVTLVRELAVSGVASLAADRAEQVHALGEGLREQKLRRVSARTLELAGHLGRAAARSDAFDAGDYAELLGDLLLTARKLEKHLAGEALAEEHVEELIGKTWTKKDRKPTAGLDLVEIAFVHRTTADDFVIRESRFVELGSGDHYSEKQILPGFLAKRSEPKKSFAGRVLRGASGSLYPGFSPRRIDLDEGAANELLGPSAVARLIERALPSVAAALAALSERRKDVFAPDTLPVALRVDRVLAEGARLQVVDPSGAALFLPDDASAEESLARVLRGATLEAIIGDVALDGALPTLFPLAVVVTTAARSELVTLGLDSAAALLESKKLRKQAPEATGRRARWVDVARRVGASNAAIVVGEIRDEMADALATGLGSVTARFADPIASRLRELGLGKQADLLLATAARQDAAEKLDDFVKLHQVLGIALSRLAGATHVDGATLVPVPTYDSVHVRAPEGTLSAREVAQLQGAGRMNRYEAAVHYARHYEAMSPADLAAAIYPTWADGSASPYIARVLAAHPGPALEAAKRALSGSDRRTTSRVARLTAVRVLAAVGTPAARMLLEEQARRRDTDVALAAHARRALAGGESVPKELEPLVKAALHASLKDDRAAALRQLGARAFVEAIPIMRLSFSSDVSWDVREAAAAALASVGDVESVDAFVRLLRERAADPQRAKIGARALGTLGDVRGIHELLEAYAEGWQPGIVAEAMRDLGPAALEPLVDLLEARPEIAERKAALGVIQAMPAEDLTAVLLARLAAAAAAPDFCARAALYVTLAARPDIAKVIVRRVVELRPAMLDKKKSSSDEKALARKCAKHLYIRPRSQ